MRVADTRAEPPRAAELAAALPGVPLTTGPFTDATFAGADLIAISPGVPKDQPAIAAAVARGAELARRHRALRARVAAGAEGARDHRHQRQDDRHRAHRRAVPCRGPCHGRRRQHRRRGARRVDALRNGRRHAALARCVRPRVVELPARDDVVAAAGGGGGAQRHRKSPRPLREHRGLRGREGARVRARRHPGRQPRRSAVVRHAHSGPHDRIDRRRRARQRKANGGWCASTARPGLRMAAVCSFPRRRCRWWAATTH